LTLVKVSLLSSSNNAVFFAKGFCSNSSDAELAKTSIAVLC